MKTTIRITVFLFFICISFFSVNAQNNKITGKVITFGKYPLKQVFITSYGDTTYTNDKGIFHISVKNRDKVIAQANGFYTKKIKVKNTNDTLKIELKLKDEAKSISKAAENGHISKENLIYAINNFEADKYNYTLYNSILDILRDRFSNITISSSGIRIRNNKTLNQGDVQSLLVVDGIIVDMSAFVNIPTSDIKSINLLKGSAATKYGAQGFGGVVVVSTKK